MKYPSIATLFFLISSLPTPVYAEKGYVIEPIAEGLNFPWSIEFLDDEDLIVAELGGTIRHVDATGKVSEPISGTPSVYRAGQGGLFDVLRHPNFSENKQVYLSYASGNAEANATTVARATWNENDPTCIYI